MVDETPHESSGPEPQRLRRGSLMSRLVPKSPSAAIQPVAAPPPPPELPTRQQRPMINFISGFLSFLLVVAVISGAGFYMGVRQFQTPGPLPTDKVVVVRGGVSDVTEQLTREGVIDQPTLFAVGLYTTGAAAQIKAGEYLFRQNASLGDVMSTLVEGKAILHAVTIPEGLSSQQIVDRLMENDILVNEVRDVPREGTLLPETYKFTRGMTRNQLIERMAQDQARVVREIWARRSPDLPLRSPQDMVTLASIVEKETARADERPRVAGVFVNRLNRQMRLQSDPTIVYGIVGGKGPLGRPLSRADISTPTPYNTYTINGLPPGPIGNPGRAALEAVANPSRTRDLYFVADGTGGHVFAETLEQHQRNVTRWRQIETDRQDATTAVPVEPAPKVEKPAETKPEQKTEIAPEAESAAVPEPKPDLPVIAPLPPEPPPSLRRQAAVATKPMDDKPEAPATPTDLSERFDLNSPKTVPKLD
jgi:UPF0755 protein